MGVTTLLGPDGLRFYIRRKAIIQSWPLRASHEASQFAFPHLLWAMGASAAASGG
nr:hypothetical protein [Pseudomonas cavernicola]